MIKTLVTIMQDIESANYRPTSNAAVSCGNCVNMCDVNKTRDPTCQYIEIVYQNGSKYEDRTCDGWKEGY